MWTGSFDDVVGEVVGLAVDGAAFEAAAGHPHREAARMMVAAVVLRREAALRVNRAAELAAPDHERFVEHAALLEILNEPVARLIDVAALIGQPAGDVGVRVPVVVVDLHEPHAALDHPPGEQGRVGERARLLRRVAVQLERRFRLAGEIRSAPARWPACGTPARTAESACASADRPAG